MIPAPMSRPHPTHRPTRRICRREPTATSSDVVAPGAAAQRMCRKLLRLRMCRKLLRRRIRREQMRPGPPDRRRRSRRPRKALRQLPTPTAMATRRPAATAGDPRAVAAQDADSAAPTSERTRLAGRRHPHLPKRAERCARRAGRAMLRPLPKPAADTAVAAGEPEPVDGFDAAAFFRAAAEALIARGMNNRLIEKIAKPATAHALLLMTPWAPRPPRPRRLNAPIPHGGAGSRTPLHDGLGGSRPPRPPERATLRFSPQSVMIAATRPPGDSASAASGEGNPDEDQDHRRGHGRKPGRCLHDRPLYGRAEGLEHRRRCCDRRRPRRSRGHRARRRATIAAMP